VLYIESSTVRVTGCVHLVFGVQGVITVEYKIVYYMKDSERFPKCLMFHFSKLILLFLIRNVAWIRTSTLIMNSVTYPFKLIGCKFKVIFEQTQYLPQVLSLVIFDSVFEKEILVNLFNSFQ